MLSRDRKITVAICVISILFGAIVKFLPKYYFIQGKSYYENKNYIKAYSSLKNAYYFDKHNKDYRYYFVHSMLKLNPTKTIQKTIFDIASDSQNDSAHKLAENTISTWRLNIMNNIGNNYIEQAPFEKGIIRWDSEKFPIKVFISNESGIEIPNYYKEEILRAFSQWQSSVKFIKFSVVENNHDANITVNISKLPDNVCDSQTCRFVVGFTTPEIKGNLLKKMKIVLYAKDPYNNFFSDKEFYNTILHEIGHSLGIMGHSYSSEDLMYMSSRENNFYSPYMSSFQYISTKDINTIKLLYKLIPDITNTENINTKGLIYAPIILGTSKDISERKLREAKNYVKNAPNLSGGYVDLGVAYAELKRNNEAIKALKKALELSKSNNEKYTALFNLAIVYFNEKDYNNAEKFAKNAKDISDTEDIKEFLAEINNKKNR